MAAARRWQGFRARELSIFAKIVLVATAFEI
jgi:hypothetical protein